MNVLVLIGQLPYPLDTGAKIRSYHLLTRLARRHSVTMLSFYYGPEDERKKEILQNFFREIHIIPFRGNISTFGRMVFALKNLACSTPYSIEKYTSHEMEVKIHQLIKEQQFDLIHCDSLQVSRNVATINEVPKVLTEHNVESYIWKRAAENERNPIRRAYLHTQARRLARYEADICRAFDWCIAVSEVDRHIIQKISGNNRCNVVPNGVDCKYFTPQINKPEPFRLVFTGSMDWLPNEDAIVYFVEEILPLIRQAIPQVGLSIVGRNPTPKIRQLPHLSKGVEVTGRVEDIRPYIAKAAVYITPLRIGSGTRLKILEAMAMGRPVVSTSVGCEGLDVTPEDNIILADDPQEFADRVTGLIKQPNIAEALGRSGRKLVEDRYDWDPLADRLEEIWLCAAQR